MKINKHTVLLLCGPSGCGKSYFAKQVKEKYGNDCVIISSDDIRRELLNQDIGDVDPLMNRASAAAFSLLKMKVQLHSSYPINTPLIIVDSTALNAGFRREIKQIAESNQYNCDIVLFNYNGRSDYMKYAKDRYITTKHVEKFYEEIRNIGQFNNRHKITSHNFPSLELDLTTYKVEGKSIIIGDVHGCYEELIQLLIKNGCTIQSGRIDAPFQNIVFVGDLIDKGPSSYEVLKLVNDNPVCKVVLGNHENFILKYLNGEITAEPDTLKHFSSYSQGKEFHELLKVVCSNAYPFLHGENFIVTHSPCSRKYLGKLDTFSIKTQRNLRYTDRDVKELLGFLKLEDQHNFPFHIFGHIACQKMLSGKSYINLDTGAVYGNKLTSVIMDGYSKPYYNSVQSKKYCEGDLVVFERPLISLDHLQDKRSFALAMQCIEGKVNYMSGTICPGDRKL